MNELFQRAARMSALLDDSALQGDVEHLLSACQERTSPHRDSDDRFRVSPELNLYSRSPLSFSDSSTERHPKRFLGTYQSFREVLRNPSRYSVAHVEATTRLVSAAAFPAFPIKDRKLTIGSSAFWKERLLAAQPQLARAAESVGCILRSERNTVRPLGTAWLLLPSVIVTNRHVAGLFCNIVDQRLSFAPGSPETVWLDGREQINDPLHDPSIRSQRSAAVVEVLHIDKSYDVALLRIDGAATTGWSQAEPIQLAHALPTPLKDREVAVIGYPDYERNVLGTVPHEFTDEEYQRIVGVLTESFMPNQGRKLVQPGLLTELVQRGREPQLQVLRHSCSTLGGNSGSVVLDLSSGKALGIHYASPDWLQDSEAVPAPVLCELLARLRLDEHH